MKVMYHQSESKDLVTINIISPTPLSNIQIYDTLLSLSTHFKGVVDGESTEQGRTTALALEAIRDANETGD